MKFYIGTDHAGIELKNWTVELLKLKGYEVEDFGPFTTDRVDYPDYAENNKIDSFTSIKNNDTIKSAWYELGHQFIEKPELKPLQKLMSDFDMNDKPPLSEPVKKSKSQLVSIKTGDGRIIVRDISTGGTIGIYDSEEKAKLAMSGVDNEDIIDYQYINYKMLRMLSLKPRIWK